MPKGGFYSKVWFNTPQLCCGSNKTSCKILRSSASRRLIRQRGRNRRRYDTDCLSPVCQKGRDGSILWQLRVIFRKSYRIFKPVKVAVSCKLNADIAALFKQEGKGYQTRMNAS
ncbi:MAG: BrnA antitoxin family protein [Treponema sp.]|nr:BrnA antitoxin family protein [Treponema sp.]